MKPILQSIRTGGTSTGIHYWINWLSDCQRRNTLREEDCKNKIAYPSPKAAMIGTLFHAWMELYHRRKDARNLACARIAFVMADTGEGVDEEARIESERLFRAYRIAHTPEEFGKVIAIEHELGPSAPISAAVGIDPYTARIDLVTKLSRSDCIRLARRWPLLETLTPGFYIVDHKTDRPMPTEFYTLSLQFTAYRLAWNAANTDMKVNGTIINIVRKTKDVDFDRVLVPINPIDEKVLHRAMEVARRNRDGALSECNPQLCVDARWGTICHYYTSGRCSRY